jgi:hypothetical protein
MKKHEGISGFTNLTLIAGLLAALAACGGGGSDGNVAASGGGGGGGSVGDQSIGGIWGGLENQSGSPILALATQTGELHWIDALTGAQGYGQGSVNGSAVTVALTYLPFYQETLADGSTFATCSGSGTVQQRQSLNLSIDCVGELGGTFSSSVSFSYDALYAVDSSLSVIAGNYNDENAVLNIAANGAIFEQDPVTGCVVNGQMSIINAQFNAYAISMDLQNCQGAYAALNNTVFVGLAILDNTVTPEELTFLLMGNIHATNYSAMFLLTRI